jgi:hypothetical protein
MNSARRKWTQDELRNQVKPSVASQFNPVGQTITPILWLDPIGDKRSQLSTSNVHKMHKHIDVNKTPIRSLKDFLIAVLDVSIVAGNT